jgi:esterase
VVKLHSDCSGSGPPVVLLHGLFGAGKNLGLLARALCGAYQVHSVDLPNHGRSGWLEGADLPAMARSLRQWMDHHGLRSASLVGHSLGGKVAMQLALACPERVLALTVADIAPVAYPAHHDAVFAALDAVAEARCRSRAEAAGLMRAHLEEGVIQFLLMSLGRGGEGIYQWRFNLEGIRRGYGAVRAAPVHHAPYRGPTLFIKGGDSDYIREEHRHSVLALFPRAGMKVMSGCGHWLHVQQPGLFNNIVHRFLDEHAH